MERTDVVAGVSPRCSALRLSQAKTLSERVGAAMSVSRASRAAIDRALSGPTAAKHRSKRTGRFMANQRGVSSNARSGLVRRLAKRYPKQQRRGRRRYWRRWIGDRTLAWIPRLGHGMTRYERHSNPEDGLV